MLRLDEFESLFRAADKATFTLRLPSLDHVLLVTDLDAPGAERLEEALRQWFGPLDTELRWTRWHAEDLQGVERLLARVRGLGDDVDLVVTYRNLESDAWCWNYSLGAYLGALLRASELPVLIVPHPRRYPALPWREAGLDDVTVLADSLMGRHELVGWGVRMCARDARLHLAHVEDDAVFARYMDAIGRIPAIDTDETRAALSERLLEDARDYIASCARVLSEARADLEVRPQVRWGHRVADFRALVEETAADLLVLPTLEADHMALHGAAYTLAVELVDTMLLMV